MRSRLLMSAAIFVAGLAVASAQTAPGGVQQRNQIRNGGNDMPKQARGQSRHAPAAAFGSVAPGPDNRRRNQHGTSGDAASPRGRSDPFSKHNDASVLAPHGLSGRGERGGRGAMASDRSILDRAMAQGRLQSQRDRREGMASDRSILDRAMAQGRLRSATNRTGRGDEHRNHEYKIHDRGGLDHPTRLGHRQTASKGHGPRELGEARGRADERELGQVHTQAVKTRGRVLNHRRGQAHAQAGSRAHSEAHSAALRPDAQQGRDEIRKVQAALNQQGFNVGDPDGKLGKRTKQALIAFQKQRGFRTTGKVDHATLDALLASTNSPAPGTSPQNSPPNPAQAVPDQAAPQVAPAAIPAEPGSSQGDAQPAMPPGTTGQGDVQPAMPPGTTGQGAQPAMPPTEPVPESPQMPDSGTSGRIPAGSPQENYKEDTVPGGDQR
jgi:hypothetical protein